MAAEPAHLEPVLRNGRGHSSERPTYRKTNKQTEKRLMRTRGSDWSVRTFVRKIYLEHKEDIFYAEPGGNESKMGENVG